jgi:hypothetical protein
MRSSDTLISTAESYLAGYILSKTPLLAKLDSKQITE